MDLEQIKQILDLVREHELSEFEIEHEGLRLKIRKDANGAHLVSTSPVVPAVVMPTVGSVPASPGPVGGTGAAQLAQALRLHLDRIENIGQDVLLTCYPRRAADLPGSVHSVG